MLGEEDRARVAAEVAADLVAGEELLFQPDRHRGQKRAYAAGRDAEVVLEDALEFEERLVVEADVVDLPDVDLRLAQAVAHRLCRKLGVVLLTREALLLR